MKIGVPGQMGTPTNANYNDEPTWGCRRFFIDHFLFLQEPSYRRLLAWKIAPYLHRVGRLQLSFMCSGGCCQLWPKRWAVDYLLSGKYADAWMKYR